MNANAGRGTWTILASFGAAFLLTAMPLPDWADPWRPAWVVLVLIYWCLAVPERVGVLSGFCAGLALDVMRGGILGHHALGLTLLSHLVWRTHRRVRMYPPWQQAVLVGLLLVLLSLLTSWLRGAAGQPPLLAEQLQSLPASVLVWPWLFVILRDLRRRARLGRT